MNRVCAIASVVWLEMMRRKDVYVLLVLLGAMLASLLSLDVFGLGRSQSPVGYVKEIGLLMAWLFAWVLAVATACRQLPEEERRGTIYPLLAKPIERWELVAGKWLGAWLISAASAAAFYLLLVVLLALRGGAFDPLTLLQGFCLHAAALAVIAALAVLLSTRVHRDAAAALSYVIAAASALLLPRMFELLAYENGPRGLALSVAYGLLPHMEFFDLRRRMVHDWGPAPWPAFFLAVLYGAALCGLLLSLAWLAYRRKRFVRGGAA